LKDQLDSLLGDLGMTLSEDEWKLVGPALVLLSMKNATAPPEDMASQGPPSSDDENTIELGSERSGSARSRTASVASSRTAPLPDRSEPAEERADTKVQEEEEYSVL
jgi:hypothetical protein